MQRLFFVLRDELLKNIKRRYHNRLLLSKVNILQARASVLLFLLIDFAIRFLYSIYCIFCYRKSVRKWRVGKDTCPLDFAL
ncbi:MAG: hypothetical protein D3925_09230 [Candidatus Electrothrix sp. AR5]|nr:hypothetical protein [Candidatus Electrothrix sp. AR5]